MTVNPDDLITKFGTIYGEEEIAAAVEVIKRGAPTNDEKVRDFEEAFAKYCGVRWAVAVTSGTTALNLGCVAAGVGRGDRVLVPAITWIATANAAALQGADVGFVDVDPVSFNMDPADLAGKITDDTKLIVPVHMYGQPCRMKEILEIAEERGCLVMTDCAHAPGAEYRGRKTGSLADMGAFSFHQQKNMSTLGEGGMLTMNDDSLYEVARMFQNHGRLGHSHDFSMVGHNYRMTDVQAAVGLVQLRKLDSLNDARIERARRLTSEIKDLAGLHTPGEEADMKHVFHLYNLVIDEKVLSTTRDLLLSRLAEEFGIHAGTHYEPIHKARIYLDRGSRTSCPVAESVAARNLTLPIHPRLTPEDVEYMGRSLASLIGCTG